MLCEICDKSFDNWRQLQAHKLSNHRGQNKCPVCGRSINKCGFKKHYETCSSTKIIINRKCLNCKNDFSVDEHDENSCCSLKCARSYSTKTKRKEINEKVSKSVKVFYDKTGRKKYDRCKNCDKPIGLTKFGYCIKCFRKTPLFRKVYKDALRKLVDSGNHKGWTSRTKISTSYPEMFFIRVLDNNGFFGKYIHEYKVPKKIYTGKSGNWFLDLFFHETNIDLEIDGKQHDYPDRKKSDEERDAILTKNGFKVYRIRWKNPVTQQNKDYLKTEIEKLLLFLRSVA